MRILFLIDSLGSGGAQRQLVTLSPLLMDKGYDVEILCYHYNDFFLDILKSHNIKVNWILVNNPVLRLFKIRSFIRKNNYNVVISFLDTPDFINCFSAIGGKQWKVITSERSAIESKFKTLKGRIFSFTRIFSDFIVCNSNNARNMWLNNFPNYDKKLKVIYNTFTSHISSCEYIPRQNDKLNIVVAASFREIKNPLSLINALKYLNEEEKSKIKIDWYGEKFSESKGGIYDKCISLIAKYRLNNIIELHSPTNQILKILMKSDIVALFSLVEGLPNTICEGMFLSKPILMTKVSDYNEFINDNNGLLCSDFSSIEISKAIKQFLVKDSSELIIMGKNSRNIANKLFNTESILKQWINLIES